VSGSINPERRPDKAGGSEYLRHEADHSDDCPNPGATADGKPDGRGRGPTGNGKLGGSSTEVMSKPPSVPRMDEDTVRRYFGLICDPSLGCMEVRVLEANLDRDVLTRHPKWRSTFSVWAEDPDTLVAQLRRVHGVSAYATVNPVKRDLLALADTSLIQVRTNTKDEDIAVIRRLFIDIDPERKSGISSTDAELALAIARRDQILADHPDIRASAFWGRSGNGTYIIATLVGYANDQEDRALIAGAIELIQARYSDDLNSCSQQGK
jgi:hypothetical protein